MQKSDHKLLYKYIETDDYESHKIVMCNRTIPHRCYKNFTLNTSHDIKVRAL